MLLLQLCFADSRTNGITPTICELACRGRNTNIYWNQIFSTRLKPWEIAAVGADPLRLAGVIQGPARL